jgi:hypothetical protein
MIAPELAVLAWLALLPNLAPVGETVVPERIELGAARLARVERAANTFTQSAQDAAAVALDRSGRSVVAWQSRRQQAGNYGIYARRFDARGEPLTAEVEVNQYLQGPQTRPAVALDEEGSAWFAWESLDQDGSVGGIFARRFDAELASATVEVLVNELTAGHQTEVALACDGAGRALVAWTSPEGEDGARSVFARCLGADGKPAGAQFRVGGIQRATLPAVAAHADGTWTVAWSTHALTGEPLAIHARRLAADGSALGAEQVLFERKGEQPVEPVLSAGARGELFGAWLVTGGEDYVPHVARFQWDAESAGWSTQSVRALPADCAGYTSGLDIAALDDGGAVLTWTRFVHGGDAELMACALPAAGEPLAPTRISLANAGDQRLAVGGGAKRIAAQAGGLIAVVWNGDAGLGDTSGAHLTLLLPDGLEPVTSVAQADVVRFAAEEGAGPHEPPVRSSGEVRREDFPASAKSLGGPDFGFLGITQTSLTPPDPHIAVSATHVVEMVNPAIAWFLRNGTFQQQIPIDGGAGFWAPVGANGFIFDPEVLFDPLSRRFFAMANERAGGAAFFLLAVSDDEDPNGTWHKYRFNVTAAAGDTDIDSPNLGVDAQAVYLTADFFGPDKYLMFMVEKAPLLSGGVPITRSLLNTGSQSWGIPVMYTAAPAYYMIEAFETSTASAVRLHAITNPLGTPTKVTFDLPVPTYSIPEDPPQLGTSTRPELFEARFWSCVFRDGRLYATHHQGSARVVQRWYEINMANWPVSGTPTLVQSGNVDPGGTVRTFFGSIGVDSLGNVGLAFARSSPTEFISMSRAYRQSGDPAGSTTPAVVMKASTAPDFNGRWGDYSATVNDPDFPRIFWGGHEFTTGAWATWIGAFGPCRTPVAYCTAKQTSLGQTPSIGWTNEPSFGVNNFSLTLTNGVPNKNTMYFFGDAPDAAPFVNAFLCVAPPITRAGLQVTSGAGTLTSPVPIVLADMGRTRFFQYWFRDPAHPDGTGVGLSNALEVTFCP